MLLLIVTIGLLNVALGFGLAMHFGYGPPGLDGILQSLGPLPATMPAEAISLGGQLRAAYIPETATTVVQAAAPAAAPAPQAAVDPLAEQDMLGEVREMALAAEDALMAGAVQAHG